MRRTLSTCARTARLSVGMARPSPSLCSRLRVDSLRRRRRMYSCTQALHRNCSPSALVLSRLNSAAGLCSLHLVQFCRHRRRGPQFTAGELGESVFSRLNFAASMS